MIPLKPLQGLPQPLGASPLTHVCTDACPQASLRVCGMCSSVSVTTLPLLPPLRMAMYSSGTSADLTGVRGCSQPTMGLSSAVTGTQRTGVVWGEGGQ